MLAGPAAAAVPGGVAGSVGFVSDSIAAYVGSVVGVREMTRRERNTKLKHIIQNTVVHETFSQHFVHRLHNACVCFS